MGRLTIRNSDGSVSQPTDLRWADAFMKLAEYEDAEEAGRMIILPTTWKELVEMRGGEAWVIWEDAVWPGLITDIYISDDGDVRISYAITEDWSKDTKVYSFDVDASHFGRDIFKTKEEAERRL